MADGINLTALASPTSFLPLLDQNGTLHVTTGMQSVLGTKQLLSGALAANTYLELVALTSPGWLRIAGVFRIDSTSRTVGLKIVIDGTTVYDQIDATAVTAFLGHYAIGGGSGAVPGVLEQWRFNASLSLQIRSSKSETDKIALSYSVATV